VPVGCLGALVVFVGGITLFAAVVYGGVTAVMRSSEPFQEALARAQASPEVTSALGEPIEVGFWLSGNINSSGSSGHVDLSIPISGPKQSGTIYVVGTKSAGTWRYTKMEIEIPGRPSRVNLLAGRR
jgi:hypothetical protein